MGVYLCLCKGVSEARVRELGDVGICSPGDLAAALGLEEKTCCGRCLRKIDTFVAIAMGHDTATTTRVGHKG